MVMIKKIISLIAAAGITASVGMPSAYAKVGLVRHEVSDNFESYDITEGAPFTGTGTRINDNWSILNGGYNNNMRVSVKDYSGNKKLAVNGSGGEGVIVYIGDTSSITGDAVMEADMKVTGWNGKTGLRFLMSSDGKSYYQLYAKEGENIILSKHVNGTQQSSVVVKEGWGTEGWAHIKMEMKDSKLTLYYTKGATTIEKSIEDDTPLTAQGSLTTCAFLDGKNESVFDNFKYYSETMDYDDSIDVAVSDNFEGYELSSEAVTGSSEDKTVAGNWAMSSNFKGGNNGGTAAIAEDPSNEGQKLLKITGKWNNEWDAVCVNYVGDRSDIVGDATLETDVRYTGDANGRVGVRFMVSADEKSYYQLVTSPWGGNPVLKQIVNNKEVKAVAFSDWWQFANTVFHIKMELKDGKMTATVTKGQTTKTLVIDDQTPLTANGNATNYSMTVIGDGTTAYFDNFKLTGTKEKHYSENTKASVSDDFEAHELTEEVSGKGTQITDGWAISSTKNGWDGNGAKGTQGAIAKDIKNTTKKVLKMIGTGNMDNAISYIGDRTGITGDKVAVETDMYYATTNNSSAAAGIRFLVSKDENTFYQVMFGEYGAAPTLKKVIDGAVEETVSFTPNAAARTFDGNRRNHITIELDGNNLTAVVLNQGNTYTASLTVGEEILADGNNTTCQFVTWGDNITAYYDNFKYYCSDTFAGRDAEPSDIMYIDVFANKKVAAADNAAAINNGNDANPATVYSGTSYTADLGEAKIIRKAVLVNPEVTGKVRILASADGNDWEYLGSFKDGVNEFVNLYTNVKFRYVQLLADSSFSFGDLRILTDSASEIFESRLNTSLYLYPRAGGVNLETPEWTYSNAGFVSVSGNKATPINVPADGTVTVTADGKVSAQIRVLPAYRAVKNEDGTVTFNMGFNFRTAATKLIAVYYDGDGSVLKVDEITPEFETNTNLDEIELTVTPPAEYDSAKLLCWDGGFIGMTPVVEAMEY